MNEDHTDRAPSSLLEKNQFGFSEPIASEMGYHVVLLDDLMKSRFLSLKFDLCRKIMVMH